MNHKYDLRYSETFYRDLKNINKYIKYKLNNAEAAQKILKEIEDAICNRVFSPISYEKYISKRNRKNVYYRIYVKNYIIFYIVEENIMEVRRILYRKKNFGKYF